MVFLYGEEMGSKICGIPILKDDPADRTIWFHASNGVYSTKSGYSWHIIKKIEYGLHRLF